MTIKANVPFEVSMAQYLRIKEETQGYCAHRIDENGKCWVKVIASGMAKDIKRILAETK